MLSNMPRGTYQQSLYGLKVPTCSPFVSVWDNLEEKWTSLTEIWNTRQNQIRTNSSVKVWPATGVLSIPIRIRIFIRVTPSFLWNCFDALIDKTEEGINAKRWTSKCRVWGRNLGLLISILLPHRIWHWFMRSNKIEINKPLVNQKTKAVVTRCHNS